jgi:hypothetical protein
MIKKIQNKIYLLSSLYLIFPAISFAALDGIKGFLTAFKTSIIDKLIPIIFGLSLIYFFWGISQFILNSADQKKRDEGKSKIIWGVVALFVFVSLYGILALMGTILGIGPGGVPPEIFTNPA